MKMESIARHNAALIMLKPPKKAAEHIFRSLSATFADIDVTETYILGEYITKIMEIISEFDMEYADKVAVEYLRLIKTVEPS